MNKARRKKVTDALAEIERQKDIIETAKSEEQECYENLPEPIQYSERGEAMQEIANSLESAVDDLDNAISNINDALNH